MADRRKRTWGERFASLFTYQNLLRIGGFSGVMYLVLFRENPDPTLLLALCAMMGLPTFWDLDKMRQGGRNGGGSGGTGGESDG